MYEQAIEKIIAQAQKMAESVDDYCDSVAKVRCLELATEVWLENNHTEHCEVHTLAEAQAERIVSLQAELAEIYADDDDDCDDNK